MAANQAVLNQPEVTGRHPRAGDFGGRYCTATLGLGYDCALYRSQGCEFWGAWRLTVRRRSGGRCKLRQGFWQHIFAMDEILMMTSDGKRWDDTSRCRWIIGCWMLKKKMDIFGWEAWETDVLLVAWALIKGCTCYRSKWMYDIILVNVLCIMFICIGLRMWRAELLVQTIWAMCGARISFFKCDSVDDLEYAAGMI